MLLAFYLRCFLQCIEYYLYLQRGVEIRIPSVDSRNEAVSAKYSNNLSIENAFLFSVTYMTSLQTYLLYLFFFFLAKLKFYANPFWRIIVFKLLYVPKFQKKKKLKIALINKVYSFYILNTYTFLIMNN